MDYSAEAAGGIASTFAITREQLETQDWTKLVETAIDLKNAVPNLNRHTKRQLARFIVNGTHPGTVNGKYPEPQAIAIKLAELDPRQDTRLVAMLNRELREVRACRAIATHMSGRRLRSPLLMRADRRLRGKPCARCQRPIQLGQAIFHDRDWGSAWHSAEGCHD